MMEVIIHAWTLDVILRFINFLKRLINLICDEERRNIDVIEGL